MATSIALIVMACRFPESIFGGDKCLEAIVNKQKSVAQDPSESCFFTERVFYGKVLRPAWPFSWIGALNGSIQAFFGLRQERLSTFLRPEYSIAMAKEPGRRSTTCAAPGRTVEQIRELDYSKSNGRARRWPPVQRGLLLREHALGRVAPRKRLKRFRAKVS
jgi:hypothetical protein